METKKYLPYKKFTQKDLGRNAIIGILGGYMCSSGNYGIIISVIGFILTWVGFAFGAIWILRIIFKSK